MKVTLPYVKVLKITNMKNDNIKVINASLGKDKGFIRILWKIENKVFNYQNRIKEDDLIWVPSGEMGLNSWENEITGAKGQTLQVWTNYVEPLYLPDKSKVEDYQKKKAAGFFDKKQGTTQEDIDSMFDDLKEMVQSDEPSKKEELEKILLSDTTFETKEMEEQAELEAQKDVEEWEKELENDTKN